MAEKEFYQWLQALVYSLQLPEWPLEKKISREEAIVLIANLLNLDPKDPELLQKAFSKLREIEAKEEIVPSIPPNLKELLASYEEYLTAQEERLKASPSYWQYYQAVLEEILKQVKNPYLTKAVSQQITQEAAEKLPQVTHPQAFQKTVTPEEYQAIVQRAVEKAEIPLPPEAVKTIAEKTQPLAVSLAATPRPFPTPPPLPSPPPISEKIPPKVTAELAAKPQGVAFRPVFTFLHPPTAVSFVKKVILAPIIKPLQWATKITEEVSPEIKKAVLEGLTSKDVQESIRVLQEAGLPSEHPKIDQLKNQEEKLAEFESSHKILAFVLRHYHEFSKKTDSRQIQEPQTRLFLPWLSPPPAWYQQKGYAWSLRQGLNRLGLFFRTHQWLPTPSGKKIIRFVLHDKIIRFITFGKVKSFTALKTAAYKKIVQPVLVWLGKTAIGEVIKAGVKKLASWALTKLGISIGVGGAAAAAAGPPGWVVALISFLPTVVSWLKRTFKKLLEKPELAILGGIALVGLPILVPMLPALGFIFTAAGIISAGIGFLSKAGSFLAGVAGKIGGFLSGAASTLGGFFSSLSTISLPSTLPVIAVGGTVGTVAVATTLVVITARSAFIKKGVGEKPPHIGAPVNPRSPAEAGHLAETVIWTLNDCGITSVNKTTWLATENCLLDSNLPNKEIIRDRFYYSVFSVGPGLQCVGFVRGVTAALGKELEGGRQAAKDYLDPPTPSGYYPVETDMNKVQVGDLVIMKGKTYGHIGIVVNKKDSYISVAQAWGTEAGLLQITQINPVYFDGFLRPK